MWHLIAKCKTISLRNHIMRIPFCCSSSAGLLLCCITSWKYPHKQKSGQERCAHTVYVIIMLPVTDIDSPLRRRIYWTTTFPRWQLHPGAFGCMDMDLDTLLHLAKTKKNVWDGERKEALIGIAIFLSFSVFASEDGLISSAPGLRFKHLSAPLLAPLFLCQPASQRLPECLPSWMPPLPAWWGKQWDTLNGELLRLVFQRLAV